MKSTIITVGNEILLGKTINTNLAFLGAFLFSLGIEVEKSVAVNDNEDAIHSALDHALGDLIILTGGLGPTHDDATKESLTTYLGLELEKNEDAYQKIASYFERSGRKMDASNDKQAFFPLNATILDNLRGTAPGAIIPHKGKHYVLLPGPPSELKPMVEPLKEYLDPFLNQTIYQKGYLVVGQGESEFEGTMRTIYDRHPSVNIAPYASTGEIRYIFTSKDEKALGDALKDFKKHFNKFIIGAHDETLETHIVKALKDQNKTITLVESCTGGMLASRLVNVSGVSDVFKESYVLYDNESKMKQLGINQAVLDKYGAVSEQCVYELAYQLAQKTDSDVSVSISGVAGPLGGTKDKPVGTVYFGITHEGKTKTYKQIFAGDRQMIREKATAYALYLVMKGLLHYED